MEAYPTAYTAHELPLLILSGLGDRPNAETSNQQAHQQESGARLVTASAECTGDRSKLLLEQFSKQDGNREAWNAQTLPGPQAHVKYRVRTIGRNYTLPPRKAAPLPQSPSAEGFQSPQAVRELHSPLSPLSPGSPIYPDGVFTPLWLAKHQWQVPAVFIAFFELSSGNDTAQNEQIQIDINAIRTALARSGFKSRFAAVLMSDRSILHAPELEDRLSAIRRATTLDPKTGLFFMPPMTSQAEIGTFVQSMLATLQPLAVEYYRDLTKHARRKKARGGPSGALISPVDGGAHALSTPGWNVRYEFKQGVYAEFRQEMDVAERHYSDAIDNLFNAEGILETTPSWSPRWDEARLLCDVIALRVVRCQLWSGLTTSATRSWSNYRARVKDLVDRRGKGSQTYSWDAWESRWAEIMAQLIIRAALSSLQPTNTQTVDESVELTKVGIYAMPEKAVSASDRLPPFQMLHHPGYWLRLAVYSARARREKAMAIPEEDCVPPGQSPASAVAYRAKSYDTYLVLDPHEEHPLARTNAFDHVAEITRLADSAAKEFAARGQVRASERLKLELSQLQANAGLFEQAMSTALPVWEECSWRENDWDELFVPLLLLVQECAVRCGNADAHLAVTLELMKLRPDVALDGLPSLAEFIGVKWPNQEDIKAHFENNQRLSPLVARFAFCDAETFVGEYVECQLSLSMIAVHRLRVAISSIQVNLSNGRSVLITQKDEPKREAGSEALIDLSEAQDPGNDRMALEADLSMAGGERRTFSFYLSVRETGLMRVEDVTLMIKSPRFSIEHKITDLHALQTRQTQIHNDGTVESRELPFSNTTMITVHPKPPKLQIVLHGLRKHYYTDEHLAFGIQMINQEEEEVQVTAIASLVGSDADLPGPVWQSEDGGNENSTLNAGTIAAAASQTSILLVNAASTMIEYTIRVEISYILLSDPHTHLSKTANIEMNLSAPFEVKFNFGPLLYVDPWPSYFDGSVGMDEEDPEGIPQKWRLGALIHSQATEGLSIKSIKLRKAESVVDAVCSFAAAKGFEEQVLRQDEVARPTFELLSKKLSFEDRRPTSVELMLDVEWCRQAGSPTVTTSITVPKLSLPTSEPRVLCTVIERKAHDDPVTVRYHIENPSNHFLTFAATMEANDDFAFSGPKYRTLSVAPLSRVHLAYHFLVHSDSSSTEHPLERVSPVLQVVDSYYNRPLRIHSGGAGVQVDDKGRLHILLLKGE
ncbi:hypothetical protein LTR86_005691 [Recurvomyces mirabilis]|nr:hypothetical protein LTR86_005691 [Recurvomyces mirabilis]